MFVATLIFAFFCMSSIVTGSSLSGGYKYIDHKEGGFACNATAMEDKFAFQKCMGGMKMCAKVATLQPDDLATLMAKEMQIQLKEMIFGGGGDDVNYLLPNEETMIQMKQIHEQKMKQYVSKQVLRINHKEDINNKNKDNDNDNNKDHDSNDDDDKTFYIAGEAHLDFGCEFKMSGDEKNFKQTVHCGFKGHRGAKVKTSKTDYEKILA